MMSKLEHSSLSPDLQGLLSLLVLSNSASLRNSLPFPLLGSKPSVETVVQVWFLEMMDNMD